MNFLEALRGDRFICRQQVTCVGFWAPRDKTDTLRWYLKTTEGCLIEEGRLERDVLTPLSHRSFSVFVFIIAGCFPRFASDDGDQVDSDAFENLPGLQEYSSVVEKRGWMKCQAVLTVLQVVEGVQVKCKWVNKEQTRFCWQQLSFAFPCSFWQLKSTGWKFLMWHETVFFVK